MWCTIWTYHRRLKRSKIFASKHTPEWARLKQQFSVGCDRNSNACLSHIVVLVETILNPAILLYVKGILSHERLKRGSWWISFVCHVREEWIVNRFGYFDSRITCYTYSFSFGCSPYFFVSWPFHLLPAVLVRRILGTQVGVRQINPICLAHAFW